MARRFALILIITLLAAPLAAQRFTASIRGTVTDPNGDALPGATVSLEGTEDRSQPDDVHQTPPASTPSAICRSARTRFTFTLDGFKASVVSDIVPARRRRARGQRRTRTRRHLRDDHGRVRGDFRGHAQRRGLRPDQRRADPRTAAQRTELRPVDPPAAGRQRSRRLRHEEQGPAPRASTCRSAAAAPPATCGPSTARTTTTSARTAPS